jgi:acetoin utilization deacetylase AcuC-like enzyme
MQVVFHEAFHGSNYSPVPYDNAADPGRLAGIMAALTREGGYPVAMPAPATRPDLLRGHSEDYVASVEASPDLFAMASLAAGAAILASDLAMGGVPAFACVRPPGHHANHAMAWGHCTFGNLALALLRLRETGRIRSALVVDFDLHTGDGTLDLLRGWPEAQVINPYGNNAGAYLYVLEERLKEAPKVDLLAVSAGFDGYIADIGHNLRTDDYFSIGRLLKDYALGNPQQRRFAVLEGGYYLPDLGSNVLAFCRGFE